MKGAISNRVAWIVSVAFLIGNIASNAAAQVGNFEFFKNQLSTPANSYRVEFIEGDVLNESSVTTRTESGRVIATQSHRHYHVTCQTNAFLLIQEPDFINLDKNHTNVALFEDCGRYGNQGWVRSDSAFVRLVDLSVSSTNRTVQNVVEKVNLSESKIWCACLFGLPKMDVSTIKWDGYKFSAKSESNSIVNGEASIDPRNGLVSTVTYRVDKKNGESGVILYSYTARYDTSSMPDLIDKRINQYLDPIYAAQRSFIIKILHFESMPGVAGSNFYLSPLKGSPYLISNGIPLTKSGDKFVSSEDLKKVTRPLDVKVAAPHSRLILSLFLGVSFMFFGLVVWKTMNKQKKD